MLKARGSDVTFYKRRSKYRGTEVLGARCLETLEPENAKLKSMLAKRMMDVVAPKICSEKASEVQLDEECYGSGDEDDRP